MHFTPSSVMIMASSLTNLASATWSIKYYESGCPTSEDDPYVGSISGEAGQELWCVDAGWAHNLVLTNIEAEGMTVELFADVGCSSNITKISTDGCKVIPMDTVIATARILPKDLLKA
ncbi:hypothetical protein QBC37DRAFT_405801 [Rhypophila decipiens]|uniref:Uncharacterized protein n=1 Tax=Rhypophila decipiens TaxID=261697 RepID=A0AAN7B068_9PEZI|nr:hypothetical protein QBC37DRAFT_405801 [Rhypophila decipiens]